MKIFIVTDIEGISGINGRKADEVGNKIINTDVACRLLTQEVNAVAEGLIEAGADEIHVWDGHGGSSEKGAGRIKLIFIKKDKCSV